MSPLKLSNSSVRESVSKEGPGQSRSAYIRKLSDCVEIMEWGMQCFIPKRFGGTALVLLLSVFLLVRQNDSPQGKDLLLNHVIVIDRTGAAARTRLFRSPRHTSKSSWTTCSMSSRLHLIERVRLPKTLSPNVEDKIKILK